jgi:hypothetical protein
MMTLHARLLAEADLAVLKAKRAIRVAEKARTIFYYLYQNGEVVLPEVLAFQPFDATVDPSKPTRTNRVFKAQPPHLLSQARMIADLVVPIVWQQLELEQLLRQS